MSTDELLITTEAKAQFKYGGVPKRIWESIRNRDNQDNPQQWQFRYEPLFLPEIGNDGALAINIVKFGSKRRLIFNVFLDNEKARDVAYSSIKRAYPMNSSQIASENISAIVLSQLSIRIPDIEQLETVKLVNKEYPATAANESFLVVIEAIDQQIANEVKELLESNTVAIYYDISYAARLATYNSVKVKFSDLKKTNLFAKLDGMKTTSVYVHRDDMRRLLEKSSSFISVDGFIENADQFDKELLKDVYERLGTKQSIAVASFDENKLKSTYNGKDLEPNELKKTLSKILQWDEGMTSCKLNMGGETGGGFNLLGLFEASGNLKGSYSKDEIVSFLRKHDIETYVEGNQLVPKSINLQQINLSDFDSENVFSSVTAYVSKVQEIHKGKIDLNVSSKQTQLDLGGRVSELETNQIPIGAIVPFFLTPDEIKALAPRWLPADGQVVRDSLSPFNEKKLLDLTDRTILGAKTDLNVIKESEETVGGSTSLKKNKLKIVGNTDEQVFTLTKDKVVDTVEAPYLLTDTFSKEHVYSLHNHPLKGEFEISGELPRQPFRRLIYLVRVRS